MEGFIVLAVAILFTVGYYKLIKYAHNKKNDREQKGTSSNRDFTAHYRRNRLNYAIPLDITPHEIFMNSFVSGCVGGIFAILGGTKLDYGTEERNRIKTKGLLLGCLFFPALFTIIGAFMLVNHVDKIYTHIENDFMDAVERESQ